jgi:hypothetical protein
MTASAKIHSSTARRSALMSGCGAALAVALALTFAARAEKQDSAIPVLGWTDWGWQSNLAEWQVPPPGHGHGPIGFDPDHPYTANAEALRNNTQPTKRLGDSRDPVLKPWAAAQMLASNEEVLRGDRDIPFAAQSRCWPGGVPGQLLFPFEPFFVLQKADEVIMIWQRDHQVRHIRLTDQHAQHVKPTWFGDSIGHYENGNSLVVDTIGLSTYKSFIDNFRTPHTDKLHVVERFTLDPDGQHLTALVTVEDADTFYAPLTMQQRWTKVPGPMRETVCAESAEDYFHQNLYPPPEATKPDF